MAYVITFEQRAQVEAFIETAQDMVVDPLAGVRFKPSLKKPEIRAFEDVNSALVTLKQDSFIIPEHRFSPENYDVDPIVAAKLSKEIAGYKGMKGWLRRKRAKSFLGKVVTNAECERYGEAQVYF